MFKLVVVGEGEAAILDLAEVAKRYNLRVELGRFVDAPSPKSRKARGSTKKKASKPKRYPALMRVKIGPAPKDLAPRILEVHEILKKEFGSKTFEKGLAKGVVTNKINGQNPNGISTHLTKLMDCGGLVAA